MPESLGRLRRVRRIGAGGFASVWLYRDEQLDSYVAVKALADNWSQQADVRDRFLEEARVLRRAASDHVVEVHDVGETDDGTPYFVMTYADQGTVADLLADGPVGVDVAVDLIEQACRGVSDLHAAGVVHRDIKPQNLLLRSDRNRDRRLLVADLGLAKALMYASGLTQIVGTPAYMAPEQAVPGAGVDERSDVHALGAVAYHVLTGQPMRDVGISDVGSAAAPDPPHRIAAVDRRLGEVVARAVQPDPVDRWPSASAFAAALREAVGVAGRGTTAPAATLIDRPGDTRIDRPGDTRIAGPPPGAALRGRRRGIVVALAALAALAVAAAAGLALLTSRDDPGDDAGPTASDSPGSEPSDLPSTPDTAAASPRDDTTPAVGSDVDPADRPYCRRVVDGLTILAGLDPDDDRFAEGLQAATAKIHAATQSAPSAVAADWRRLDHPFQDLRTAQDRIGLSLQDFQDHSDALTTSDPRVRQLRKALKRFTQTLDALDTAVRERIRSDTATRCDVDIEDLPTVSAP